MNFSHVSLLQELKARGLVAQTTDSDSLEAALNKSLTFYCGFDPTADSLHVGHLILIVLSQHLQRRGHRPILVMGGATGRIGDPSFKLQERVLSEYKKLDEYSQKIEVQLRKLFDFSGKCAARVCNNLDWLAKLDLLSFLRNIGKYFSLNSLLNRDSIKQRIERPKQGISYTEFSYVLLQSYDYLYLYTEYGVTLQLGGSDQWGNIVSGVHLIAQKKDIKVHALTVPLITKSDGSKFGKTENGVIWLCPEKTSPYDFYQFWFNTPDEQVLSYLKRFTFLPLDQLEQYTDLSQHPANAAQKLLAGWMTRWIHGENAVKEIESINNAIFDGNISSISKAALDQVTGLPRWEEKGLRCSLFHVLKATGLCSSLKEAKRQLAQGAIYLNETRLDRSVEWLEKASHALESNYTILKRGKKHFALVYWNC